MRMVDLVAKKRAGEEHSQEELHFIVQGYTAGRIPDYQMSAWMMAVCFRGMTSSETAALTCHMAHSGDVMDLSSLPGIKVDKHSTGGVGDTTTLVVAPIVAACGGTVAKMSGRGLGHTGGTLDKLESIPGTNVNLDRARFEEIVRDCGLCVAGQTADLVPADKLMYALRDVTATVESPPLIAASVMSKKLAAGADAIVLDVKCGSGAFMKTPEDARALARTMVSIGAQLHRNTVALITDMNQPLGSAVGNGLEVREAVELLRGKLPETAPLYQICLLLAGEMLCLSGLAATPEQGRAMARSAVTNGSAFARLARMISLMGGDASLLAQPDRLCQVKTKHDVFPAHEGYITAMDAAGVGRAAQLLGAGRATKTDVIDPAVGLVLHRRIGDFLRPTDALATLYVNDESRLSEARAALLQAILLGDAPPAPLPALLGRESGS